MRTRYLAGDIVSRRKGLVMHKGVSLGGGRILHNTPFRGEHVCTEEEFADGHGRFSVSAHGHRAATTTCCRTTASTR
jgi:hypothetical protein